MDESSQPRRGSDDGTAIYRIPAGLARLLASVIYATLFLIESMLFLGFVLQIFGANPSTEFVSWAYRSVDRLMSPFDGIFGPIGLGTASNKVAAVFDPSILFAMLVYAIVCIAGHGILTWIAHRMRAMEREHRREEREDRYRAEAAAYGTYRPDVMGQARDNATPTNAEEAS